MIIEESFHNIEDFQRVAFTRPELVLLYFTAPWCHACEDQLSALRELEKKYPKLRIYSISIESQMFLIECFQIRGIPYIVGMKDKKVVQTFQGLASLECLEECVTKFEN